MLKKELLYEISRLNAEYYDKSIRTEKDPMLTLEKIMLEYVVEHPEDAEVWIMLAMLEFTPPLYDYDRITMYLKKAINLDKTNAIPYIALGFMQSILHKAMEEETLEMLNQFHSNNSEIQSMIEYVKSLYYLSLAIKNDEKQEKLLIKSISLCNKFVHNYWDLGSLYLKQGRIQEGKELITKALANVQKIYQPKSECIGPVNIEEFLNERIKGIHLTRPIYESLEKNLKN